MVNGISFMEARIMENDNGNDSIYQIIREINDLLQKLEDTIRAAGINTPEEILSLKKGLDCLQII